MKATFRVSGPAEIPRCTDLMWIIIFVITWIKMYAAGMARGNVLRITVSSPTLAQGLNLSATAIVLHHIIRHGEPIKPSEFRNVVGRAGRAFVDVEGLVIFPFFERNAKLRAQWEALISHEGHLEMESGVLRLVITLLQRMQKQLRVGIQVLTEYVLNNAAAWVFPVLATERAEERANQERVWHQHLATLDTAILSLIGEQDIPDDQVAEKLDQILSSSLWERRLAHRSQELQGLFKNLLHGRAKYLWANSTAVQRRAYFLAGVGHETGRSLDLIAEKANELLLQANGAILNGNDENAIAAITALAERLFQISPFIPNPLPANRRDVLKAWLLGQPIVDVADDNSDVLRFIENGLIYRLPWAMEAIRVRAEASGDQGALGLPFDAFETGLAVPAVEVGSLNRSAAVLMQAGFTSRLAAIKAVIDTAANFDDSQGLRAWLRSDEVFARSEGHEWPTPETSEMWRAFLSSFVPPEKAVWKDWTYRPRVAWNDGKTPAAGTSVRVVTSPQNDADWVVSADFELLGHLTDRLDGARKGLVRASVDNQLQHLSLSYIGPADLVPAQGE